MILDKLYPFYFILSFSFGLFICYISQARPKVVVKFPSPVNAGNIVYKDKAGQCYKYTSDKVSCPTNSKNVKPQPILEDFKNLRKQTNQAT
jgi:hypothetical protein